jgi:hypothetical protein
LVVSIETAKAGFGNTGMRAERSDAVARDSRKEQERCWRFGFLMNKIHDVVLGKQGYRLTNKKKIDYKLTKAD